MKHHLYFLISAYFLGIAVSCAAMETHKKKPDILMELTCIEKPWQAIYLTEDCAVIKNTNKCSFVNVATNTEVRKIWDNPSYYGTGIEVHPDKTKIAFFYHTKKSTRPKIAIYNIHTGTKEWSKKTGGCSITSASFSRLDDTIATCESYNTLIKIYNYTTNKTVSFDIKSNYEDTEDMVHTTAKFHPTMPLMSIVRRKLYVIDLTTLLSIDSQSGLYNRLCEYSPNGSYRASYDYPSIYIDTLCNTKIISTERINLPISDNDVANNILFHPNNSILAILTKYSILQYWDIREKKLIYESPSLLDQNQNLYNYDSCLSFSPNGTKLMITLRQYDKCIILPVPFKAIYECDTKEHFLYLLFLLKNIDHNQTDRLPLDMIQVLMNNLFGAFKR